ncbi:HD-GYP domain-containing protein (c-di-GMP phosphodiesterase class II) [Deinobacterium chartae]|uniref:HD-GYP domain-containing protein (C-di-GMP phosphodiesterase class II) n=1 Tax=Deinobacterium chartae TaxID=521158 RepID=A0A841I8A9_9DEIO|nr:HD domain-containing phosphohydrolase [Deinobacterium chartae]MBB6100062.1 HD-GYP domain-containing protein (c-di-GMP phosphodiesterase class II) [Deinobacterium chartae]
MFRRKTTDTNVPSNAPDLMRALSELVASRNLESLLTATLVYAIQVAPTATRGYAVVREGTDRVAAVAGYGREMIGLELTGPWNGGMARVATNLAAELFQPNSPEVRAKLASLGLREVTSSLVVPLRDRSQILGAIVLDAYGSGTFNPAALEAVTRFAQAVTPLVELIASFNSYQQLAWGLTRSFVEAVEARDFTLLGHAQRVTSYAIAVGRELDLSLPELQELWFAAMLHDIGKLLQDGLNDQDGGEHAQLGYNLLSDLPALSAARMGVLHHHERWDGQGKPQGLRAEAISIYGRIIAACNTYDHLTSERGEQLSAPEGLRRLQGMAGSELDPQIVERLGQVLQKGRSTAELRPDGIFPTSH